MISLLLTKQANLLSELLLYFPLVDFCMCVYVFHVDSLCLPGMNDVTALTANLYFVTPVSFFTVLTHFYNNFGLTLVYSIFFLICIHHQCICCIISPSWKLLFWSHNNRACNFLKLPKLFHMKLPNQQTACDLDHFWISCCGNTFSQDSGVQSVRWKMGIFHWTVVSYMSCTNLYRCKRLYLAFDLTCTMALIGFSQKNPCWCIIQTAEMDIMIWHIKWGTLDLKPFLLCKWI